MRISTDATRAVLIDNMMSEADERKGNCYATNKKVDMMHAAD